MEYRYPGAFIPGVRIVDSGSGHYVDVKIPT